MQGIVDKQWKKIDAEEKAIKDKKKKSLKKTKNNIIFLVAHEIHQESNMPNNAWSCVSTFPREI